MSTAPADRSPTEAVERVRRRLRLAPRWAAVVALLVLVGLAWGLWYVTHRQFLATWSINAAGGDVEWQLDEGLWRRGGVSHVRFGAGWGMPGAQDRDLMALLRLAHVRSLTLHRCDNITAAGLAKVLPRLTELRELDISNVPGYPNDDASWLLGDAVTAPIASLNDLEELTLTNMNITDAGLARLARLPKLKRLDLSGTKVTDASLPLLETRFPALEHVALERTDVTDAVAKRLMQARPGLAIDHPATLPGLDGALPSP